MAKPVSDGGTRRVGSNTATNAYRRCTGVNVNRPADLVVSKFRNSLVRLHGEAADNRFVDAWDW